MLLESIFSVFSILTTKYGFVREYIVCEDADDERILYEFVSDVFEYNSLCDQEPEILIDAKQAFIEMNGYECGEFYEIKDFRVISDKEYKYVYWEWMESVDRNAIRIYWEWFRVCKDRKVIKDGKRKNSYLWSD